MSSMRSCLPGAIATRLLGRDESPAEEKKDDGDAPAFLTSGDIGTRVAAVLAGRRADDHAIHDESLLKIARQLEFWHVDRELPDGDVVDLAERLARAASWRAEVDVRGEEGESGTKETFRVPKVRFGRTELQMPIITCGGMRVQETWIPDIIPVLRASKKKVLKSASQDNLKDVILCCLKLGLNHFETARFYGSSEMQFVDALVNLVEDGTVKRSDFIFQTKCFPSPKRADFEKQWAASWANVERLGYVDLFSFHCVSDEEQVDTVLNDAEDGVMAFALQLQKEGKIHHIGFSTHGPADNILRLVSSNKFSYVNVHKHHFGDYHAEGTPDGEGGHGNGACVRKALELDMGVFLISPFDKGGKLYRPSARVAGAIGPGLSPIAFAALHAWKTNGFHTISVGLARSSDLDEVVEAARIYAEERENADGFLRAAEDRLKDLAVEKLGKEWVEKGMLNVPNCYSKSTDGMALGHMLWLHNCVEAYGMYEFSKDRYKQLEKTAWKKNLTFEENVKKNINAGNAGRAYDADVDLDEALEDHYDPKLVKEKLAECHAWLGKDSSVSDDEKTERGWNTGYNLTTWEEFPGEAVSLSSVLLNRMGLKDVGPTERVALEATKMRTSVQNLSDNS